MSKPVIYTWGNKLLTTTNGSKVLGEPCPYIRITGGHASGHYITPACNRGTVTQVAYNEWIWASDDRLDWSNAFSGLSEPNGASYEFTFVDSNLVQHTDYMFAGNSVGIYNLSFGAPQGIPGDEFGRSLQTASFMFYECTGIQYILHGYRIAPAFGVLSNVESMFDHSSSTSANVPQADYYTMYELLSACQPASYQHCFRGCPNVGSLPEEWR